MKGLSFSGVNLWGVLEGDEVRLEFDDTCPVTNGLLLIIGARVLCGLTDPLEFGANGSAGVSPLLLKPDQVGSVLDGPTVSDVKSRPTRSCENVPWSCCGKGDGDGCE